jgi:hypothetical protein
VIKYAVEGGVIQFEYTPTNEMVADVFTKGLVKQKFARFRARLGVVKKDTYEGGREHCRDVMSWQE